MCFDICTINIRVSIRVRGLHLVFFVFGCFFLRFRFIRFSAVQRSLSFAFVSRFLAIMLLHVEKHVAGGAGMNFLAFSFRFLFFCSAANIIAYNIVSYIFSSYMRHLSHVTL
jgi:hypothetical protein